MGLYFLYMTLKNFALVQYFSRKSTIEVHSSANGNVESFNRSLE